MGIYYEDLYPLVKPLHNVRLAFPSVGLRLPCPQHEHHHRAHQPKKPTVDIPASVDLHPELPPFTLTIPSPGAPSSSAVAVNGTEECAMPAPPASVPAEFVSPVIPPINAYGTFKLPPSLSGHTLHPTRSSSTFSVASDPAAERRPLLPGEVPSAMRTTGRSGLWGNVKVGLIPFGGLWRAVAHALGFRRDVRTADGRRVDVETGMGVDDAHGGVQRRWAGDDANGNPMPITPGASLLSVSLSLSLMLRWRLTRTDGNRWARGQGAPADLDVGAARDLALEAPAADRGRGRELAARDFALVERVGERAGRARGCTRCGAWGHVWLLGGV